MNNNGIEILNTQLRLDEALKVMRSLQELGVTKEICPDLNQFSTDLNDWVKTGKLYNKTVIKLPEIKKKLMYQLAKPGINTVVKLVEM